MTDNGDEDGVGHPRRRFATDSDGGTPRARGDQQIYATRARIEAIEAKAMRKLGRHRSTGNDGTGQDVP